MHLVRFTRPSLGVQTPARGCELFFVPGVFFSKSFFSRGGGRVFRPCGVGWNLRVSGAINGRPGRLPAFCAAAPQHPSTSVLSSLPRDLLRGAPWVEVQRDRPRGFVFVYSRGCARLLQRPVLTVASAWEREDCSWRLLLFLGLLYCQRPRAQQSAPRAAAKFCPGHIMS